MFLPRSWTVCTCIKCPSVADVRDSFGRVHWPSSGHPADQIEGADDCHHQVEHLPSPPLVPVEGVQACTGQRPEQKPNAEEAEEAGQKMRHLHNHHTAHVSIWPDQQQAHSFPFNSAGSSLMRQVCPSLTALWCHCSS